MRGGPTLLELASVFVAACCVRVGLGGATHESVLLTGLLALFGYCLWDAVSEP